MNDVYYPPASGFTYTYKRVKGYRPIEVTLTFRDGSKAYPDSIGTPQVGSVYHVGPEILRAASTEETIQREGELRRENIQSKTESSTLSAQVFITAERPLLQGARGASIRLYWHETDTPIPSSGDVPISPSKVSVDSQLGLIEVTEAPPAGRGQIVAYYYAIVTEKSSRLFEGGWDSAVANLPEGTDGFSTMFGLSQVYPVTRNVTDYLYGKTSELRPPNMERSSPDYYPVYEYRIESDGTLQFSVPLHPFSDQPAEVEVRYPTLAIEPRILVDLTRDADAGTSPEIPPLKIAVETLTS